MSEPQDMDVSESQQTGEAGSTGVAAVDAVLDAMAGVDELPLDEHVGVYESAHEQLRRALDTRPQLPVPGAPSASGAASASGAGAPAARAAGA